jgi:hypothetical protein
MTAQMSYNPLVAARFGHGYTLVIEKEPTDFNGLLKRVVWTDGTHYSIHEHYDEPTLEVLAGFAKDSPLTTDDINHALKIADQIARHYATGGDRNPERKLFTESKIGLIINLMMDLYAAVDYRQYLDSRVSQPEEL